MRIVVTGATGNVGSQVVPQLLEHPAVTSVVGVARRLPAQPDPRVEWVAADLVQDDLHPVVRGADVVIHLAFKLQPAHDEALMAATNLTGSERVFAAVLDEGVPALVHASSVGTYAAGPDLPRADESHPATGVPTSTYSRHKAAVEARLDLIEAGHPELRLVRLRPGLILQGQAASAIARYFLGPFVPQSLVRRRLLPVVPKVDGLAIQAVHTADVGAAFVLAATSDVRGAFNIAGEPVLDPPTLARLLGARQVPVPRAVLRVLVDLSWRLRLQPTDPGWLDLAIATPLMDTSRAREVLGWTPRHSSGEALLELLDGMAAGQGGTAPVLAPRATGPARLLEAARGVLPGRAG